MIRRNNMEFLSILLDIAMPPMPPGEPTLWAKIVAAVSAVAGSLAFSAYKLIIKVVNRNKGDKK